MVDYQDFGKQVRAMRRKNSLTQEELAEKVGISASFMGHIERGTRVASLETLIALCNVLKTSPHQLLNASLSDDISEHMPNELSSEQRGKLSAFLRYAQDAVDNWVE